MAVCNLFKKLTKDTGNFLMFAQYADDLTKYLVRHNDAKAIPSRFLALNIDYSKLNSISEATGTDLNEKLPTYLQNYYENACAFFKDYETSETNESNFVYTPITSRNVFWNVLTPLLTFEDWSTEATEISGTNAGNNVSLDLKYIPEIVYRGDINIQSYTEEDNIGYNEIYCYIPNDAKQEHYCVTKQNLSNYVVYPKEYIEGYTSEDQGFTGLLNISIPSGTEYSYDEGISFYDENGDDLESVSLDSRNFKFNTIVVLYDVYFKDSNDDQIRYKDIPLGLYVTGEIDETGEVSNDITKYVSNNDIYGAGTSYGLRIATRFAVTPNATTIKEITIDDGSDYSEFTKVMSSFSESQSKMNDVLSTVNRNELSIKNQLSSFKNYRTNIPYILDVNGTKYWFVNGKNTNATVMGTVGPMGPTGPQGPEGKSAVGIQGVTGPQGVTGASYELGYNVTLSRYNYNNKLSTNAYVSTTCLTTEIGLGKDPTYVDGTLPGLIHIIGSNYSGMTNIEFDYVDFTLLDVPKQDETYSIKTTVFIENDTLDPFKVNLLCNKTNGNGKVLITGDPNDPPTGQITLNTNETLILYCTYVVFVHPRTGPIWTWIVTPQTGATTILPNP